MQAAGINDTSYSVRHGGGAQRIVAACFSALGIFAYRVQVLRETFTVNYGRCQCRYSPSDYRRRMSHCLSVCLSVFISIHPTFLACYGNHLPTHASSHCRYFLLIRSVIKVSSIALAIRFVITALFTRQACKSTTSDSVSRTGLLESRQTSARSKSGDTALVKMQRCSRAAKSLINLTILAGARAQVMEKGSTPVIPPL